MKRRLLMIAILITGLSVIRIAGVLSQNPQTHPKKPDTTKTIRKPNPRADTVKVKPTTKKKAVRDTLHYKKNEPVDTVYRK